MNRHSSSSSVPTTYSRSRTPVKPRDINNNFLHRGTESPRSSQNLNLPKAPLRSSQTLHRATKHGTSLPSSRFSSGDLTTEYQNYVERIKRKNLEVGNQFLNTFRSSSKNSLNNEDGSIDFKTIRNSLSSYNGSIGRQDGIQSQPTKPNSNKPSGWPNNFKQKYSPSPAEQTVKVSSIKLVPIGVQNLETSTQKLTFPNNTNSRLSRSRSSVRTESEPKSFSRPSSLNRNEIRSSWQGDSLLVESPFKNKREKRSNEVESWYKPNFSREEAINNLLAKPTGSFVVRKSTTHPGLYVLALKTVDTFNGNISQIEGADIVRHYLIESAKDGIYLRGYNDVPKFENLGALVDFYKENISLLPCRLGGHFDEKFAMFHIKTMPTELTNELTSLKRAFDICLSNVNRIRPSKVDIRLSFNGIFITSAEQISHLRNYYSHEQVSFCCVDPILRRFTRITQHNETESLLLFGFITKGSSLQREECHAFAMQDVNNIARFLQTIFSFKGSTNNKLVL